MEAYGDNDNIGWSGSADPQELEMSGCRPFPATRSPSTLRMCVENTGCVSGDGVAAGGEVHARKVDSAGDHDEAAIEYGVSDGRSAGYHRRRCGGSLTFPRS